MKFKKTSVQPASIMIHPSQGILGIFLSKKTRLPATLTSMIKITQPTVRFHDGEMKLKTKNIMIDWLLILPRVVSR